MTVSRSVLSGKKVVYYSVLDLFPLNIYVFSCLFFVHLVIKKFKSFLRDIKKIYVVVVTFFSELCCRRSVIDGYINPTDDN